MITSPIIINLTVNPLSKVKDRFTNANTDRLNYINIKTSNNQTLPNESLIHFFFLSLICESPLLGNRKHGFKVPNTDRLNYIILNKKLRCLIQKIILGLAWAGGQHSEGHGQAYQSGRFSINLLYFFFIKCHRLSMK